MDPVQRGGPWTRSMKGVPGPGPKRGSMDQGSMFCPLPKLESSHTRICSAHFEGGEKKYRRQLPSIFPWSKPCKVRKPPTRRRLDLNDVLSTSNLGDLGDLSPCVESEVEVGAVEEVTETFESEALESDNV